jgi:hypothetical protein
VCQELVDGVAFVGVNAEQVCDEILDYFVIQKESA